MGRWGNVFKRWLSCSYKDCTYLIKTTVILWNIFLISNILSILIHFKTIYSCAFQQSLLQSSVSQDPPEIILTCWFAAQETFLITINFENRCVTKYLWNVLFFLMNRKFHKHFRSTKCFKLLNGSVFVKEEMGTKMIYAYLLHIQLGNVKQKQGHYQPISPSIV